MKTLVLFGSPRKEGNTRQLVNAFVEVLKEKHSEIRLLYLNDVNVRPCQGCMKCSEQGVCRITDDMRDIRKYMSESDLIVFATPIYWYAPSAQLKVVIDRSVAFLDKDYNSRIMGKKAVTLMTCGDTDVDTCRPALEMFKKTFQTLGVEYAGGVEATGCLEKGQVVNTTLEAARKLAGSLP